MSLLNQNMNAWSNEIFKAFYSKKYQGTFFQLTPELNEVNQQNYKMLSAEAC